MPDWILLALAAGGVGGVAAYVRCTGHLGGIGLLITAAAHGALLLFPVSLPPSRAPRPPIEFEVAAEFVPEPEPKPAPEPTPEPEPEPEPEPTLDPKPAPPPPKLKPARQPKPKRRKKPQPSRAPSPEPAPLRFDLTATTSNSLSGVVVVTGTPTRPTGAISRSNGSGSGSGTGGGPVSGSTAAPPSKGKDWNPGSAASLASLPLPLRVPKIVCPATESRGVTGTVKLRVQVRADGRVRKVRVVKRLGSGCDGIAKRALERAKFRPAKRIGGKPTDYEIDYEYVFSTR